MTQQILLTLAAIALTSQAAFTATEYYSLQIDVQSGGFNGATYNGSFRVTNVETLTGSGTESLPIQGLEFNPYGGTYGPKDAGTAVYEGGVLDRIILVDGAPSPFEGNLNRNFGFNAGFGQGQIPGSLAGGRWWGYLDTFTFVDGFGPYTLTLVNTDTDGDGLTDDVDQCPESDLRSTIWIGECDSGVSNNIDGAPVDAAGCSLADYIAEQLAEAAANARNHGRFVSWMARYLNLVVETGHLTWEDHVALMSCIAQADKSDFVQ